MRLLQQSVFQASTARTPLLGALLLVSEALGESGASRLATISNQLVRRVPMPTRNGRATDVGPKLLVTRSAA